jgi:hypothetical protein
MRLTRTTLNATAKAILVLAGFASGLIAGLGGSSQGTVVEGLIGACLGILIMPLLIVLLFRFEVAIGIFKPPWEPPNRARSMNPLSLVQLGSYFFTAVGAGATMSIAWTPLAGINAALIGFSGGIALYIGLVRLMKRYSLPHTNDQGAVADSK